VFKRVAGSASSIRRVDRTIRDDGFRSDKISRVRLEGAVQ
jgi:hypothetical protein